MYIYPYCLNMWTVEIYSVPPATYDTYIHVCVKYPILSYTVYVVVWHQQKTYCIMYTYTYTASTTRMFYIPVLDRAKNDGDSLHNFHPKTGLWFWITNARHGKSSITPLIQHKWECTTKKSGETMESERFSVTTRIKWIVVWEIRLWDAHPKCQLSSARYLSIERPKSLHLHWVNIGCHKNI
jgi:hypothetical protein